MKVLNLLPKSKWHSWWGLFGLLLGVIAPFFFLQPYNFSALKPLLPLFSDWWRWWVQWMPVEPGLWRIALQIGIFSWKVRVAESLPRLASPPFPSWQHLHVKWLHSWTVNSKACAPIAAWQEEEVIFCMELNSLLSASDFVKNTTFLKDFSTPHLLKLALHPARLAASENN